MRDNARQIRERIELNARDHPMGRVQIVPRRFAMPHNWITPLAIWTPDIQRQIDEYHECLADYGIQMPREDIAKLMQVEYPEPRPQEPHR